MKKYILLLSLLLVGQGVLIGLGLTSRDTADFSRASLLNFDSASVDEIIIHGTDNARVHLKKMQGSWHIQDTFSVAASQEAVQTLLSKLQKMQTSWPVATTPEAAKRFKVAADKFERYIILKSNSQPVAQLYIGTSPSFRQVHVRLPDSNEIMTADFAVYDAGDKNKDWLDTHLLKLDREKIKSITIGSLAITRDNNTFAPADLTEDEQVNTKKMNELVNLICDLQIDDVAGNEEKPEFTLDDPLLTCTITLENGESINWIFGNKESKDNHVLKTSNHDLLFKVQHWRITQLLEATRDKLVTRGTAQTPQNPPDEPVETEPKLPTQ